ncbi:MAG: hypothetical protein AB7P20_07970 [Rhizobiaceae bacterium]
MTIKELVDRILKDARKWDRRYLDVTLHAIRNFESEGDAEDLIERFLSEGSAVDFNLANPRAKDLFLAELLPNLLRHVAMDANDPSEGIRVSCAFATFLRPEWNCAEGHIDFDIGKAKKVIRNALSGFDFVGRFEPVTYQNEFHGRGEKRGPLVCFHCHCIVWTSASYSKLERLRRSLKHRFGGGLDDDEGPDLRRLQTLEDVGNTAKYMSKLPALGKRTEDRNGGGVRQKSRKISYRSYYATFNELRKHDMYTFWLSGGDGAKLLRDARRRLAVEYDEYGPRRRFVAGKPRRNFKHRGPRGYGH